MRKLDPLVESTRNSMRWLRVSRRVFLQTGIAGLVGGRYVWAASDQVGSDPAASQCVLPRKSVVVRCKSTNVCAGPDLIRPNVLEDMLQATMRQLTHTASVKNSWLQFFKPNDVIGIKCNQFGEQHLRSLKPLTECVVRSLVDSGWPVSQIVIEGIPRQWEKELKTRPFEYGWTEMVSFGQRSDQLSILVQQCSALLNIPVLKQDHLFGISGCFKNVTYYMLRHQARYHDNHGIPDLVDAYTLPQLCGKLRLNIMNGLRAVVDQGPLATAANVSSLGLLAVGSDPVAVDITAADELNTLRAEKGLHPIRLDEQGLPLLFNAAAKGVGHVDFRKIERLKAAYE